MENIDFDELHVVVYYDNRYWFMNKSCYLKNHSEKEIFKKGSFDDCKNHAKMLNKNDTRQEEKLKRIKEELEPMSVNEAKKHVSDLYKSDKITYQDYIALFKFIYMHKTKKK